jgi:hypothetical protein
MRERRSASQVLFGFLPDQTVDLAGRVWKVVDWVRPNPEHVDITTLRAEIERQAYRWEQQGTDNGFANDLRRGAEVKVLSLSLEGGVRVVAYPKLWLCKVCRRVSNDETKTCPCGKKTWGQFHFVAYHDCGALKEPWFGRCPQHGECAVRFPGTASAAEIEIYCPTCNAVLQRGLGFPPCQCGGGRMTHTVHRASVVYTPRSVVVVNAPDRARMEHLQRSGGSPRALQWVLDGMQTADYSTQGNTAASLRSLLAGQGLGQAFVDATVAEAVRTGQVTDDTTSSVPLDAAARGSAEREAVTLATALAESRLRVQDLAAGLAPGSEAHSRVTVSYREAMERAGIDAVELIDRFPVLTGQFGYTRGDPTPGASRLVPFRQKRAYAVYADIASTEALFFRLKASRVAGWLLAQGVVLEHWADERSARLSVIQCLQVPAPGTDPPEPPTAGSLLLSLIHSISHRLVRHTSVLAGIDRNSLSELLVPLHLGFFVYALARGGFVLGGLQALFENELDRLLDQVVLGEHRCPLDPSCVRHGAACVGCLHIGEPSCRYFNRFLDRRTLFGPIGYFSSAATGG